MKPQPQNTLKPPTEQQLHALVKVSMDHILHHSRAYRLSERGLDRGALEGLIMYAQRLKLAAENLLETTKDSGHARPAGQL